MRQSGFRLLLRRPTRGRPPKRQEERGIEHERRQERCQQIDLAADAADARAAANVQALDAATLQFCMINRIPSALWIRANVALNDIK
jgi:hypothetical protein